MSDTSQDDWTTEAAPPPKKKGFPSWLLFCGGGCLVAVLLAVLGIFLVYDNFKDIANPEAQWTSLEQVVEMDARPNEMMMTIGGGAFGTDMWALIHEAGYTVMIIRQEDASEADRNEVFQGNVESAGIPGVSEIKNQKVGEITLQGRTFRVSRFQSASVGQVQQGCFLDITPEGDAGFTLCHISNTQPSSTAKPISDELIAEIFKAFKLGPDREAYVPSGPHPQKGQTSLSESNFEQSFKVQTELEAPAAPEDASSGN